MEARDSQAAQHYRHTAVVRRQLKKLKKKWAAIMQAEKPYENNKTLK
jgi:hypothetical protein